MPRILNSMGVCGALANPHFIIQDSRRSQMRVQLALPVCYRCKVRGWKLHLSVGSPGEYNNRTHCHLGDAVVTPRSPRAFMRESPLLLLY